MTTQPPIDLLKLTDGQLRNYLDNCESKGRLDLVKLAVVELNRRGAATKRDYSKFPWNQARVKDELQPFVKISKEIKNNQRTSYTEAGGAKIGKAKDDPARRWVDTYTAIKNDKMNAVFLCQIKSPGDDPDFQIRVNEQILKSFNKDQLEQAVLEWGKIAEQAK